MGESPAIDDVICQMFIHVSNLNPDRQIYFDMLQARTCHVNTATLFTHVFKR